MARIRSSSRGKTAAVAAAARDIDFRHLWRQLCVVGWTAKRPRGIQREWTYAKTSKASRKKSTVATKEASKATAAAKKPRKKSARTLAKEVREAAVAAAKAAKVKAAQDKATEQQRAGKEAKSAARKRLEGKNKRRKTATAMGSNSPKRWGSPHRATNDSEERYVQHVYLQHVSALWGLTSYYYVLYCSSSSDSRRAERAVTPATSGANSDLATPASLLLRTTTHGETSRPQPTARIADPLPRSAPSTAHDGPPLPQPAESSEYVQHVLCYQIQHLTNVVCSSGLNLGALDSDCEDEDEELVFVDEEDVPVDPPVPAEIPDIAETIDSAAEEEEVVAVGGELESDDDEAVCDWPVLDSEEYLDFAKDKPSLARMRRTGWELGTFAIYAL
ncbi:hypothetical protein AM588_10001667 [Phytophthora nicotianae]|uniref:Uncharacterized protein n=1 Tax=Phytophthora nicotianae TaxID=4792 RepID=A0A0W8CVG8_PHYNI|nr:hypothetical protein AM588_10001667 [Phytophthora nicotianae]